METPITMIGRTITEEHTCKGSKIDFASVTWSKERPIEPTKHLEESVIWLTVVKNFKGRFGPNNGLWNPINEVTCRLKSFIP